MRATYAGRRVLVTGHTGFKGGWLCLWLRDLGANVTGYGLPPSTAPSLFADARIASLVCSVEGDIRDRAALDRVWNDAEPEIVFHLAAQSLVRESYHDPLSTLETNVIGTANVLELARTRGARIALVIVTSDKCYENRESDRAYRETDPLGGHDLYSASKAATELVAASYRRSFFEREEALVSMATARAGNVIGGGDWADGRLVPDCIRSLEAETPVALRNPEAVRPWQHVLDPLSGYMQLGSRLLSTDRAVRQSAQGAWNFGPAGDNARSVREVAESIGREWGRGEWIDASDPTAPHEAGTLRLSVEKASASLGWIGRWDFEESIRRTVDWYRARHERDAAHLCVSQINDYSPVAA